MRALSAPLFALALTLLPSCAFLLDFDDLQSKDELAADGGAGGAASCTECPDDGDPCTAEECTADGCRSARRTGIVPDGLAEVIPFDVVHRVTMTSRGNRAYLSVHFQNGAALDTRITSFDAESTEIEEGLAISSLGDFEGASPVSAAGLVAAEPGAGLDAFVAIGNTPDQGVVLQLSFSLDVVMRSAALVSSDTDVARLYTGTNRVHPIAWRPPGGDVAAAWPVAAGGVEVYVDSLIASNTQLGTSLGKVTALAPLAAGNQPAVFYATENDIFVQALGQLLPSRVEECGVVEGAHTSAATGFTGIEGIWYSNWTRRIGNGYASESKAIGCFQEGAIVQCGAGPRCDSSSDVQQAMRNPAFELFRIQGDPAGRVYQAVATSVVDGPESEGVLVLNLIQIDIDADGLDSGGRVTPLTDPPVELAREPLGPRGEGPNWPALAVLPPDRVAVAWIQPAENGDELRIERHRICLPE